jgi:hypothetical protein
VAMFKMQNCPLRVSPKMLRAVPTLRCSKLSLRL